MDDLDTNFEFAKMMHQSNYGRTTTDDLIDFDEDDTYTSPDEQDY